MPIDWSDRIVVAELSDEPLLSEELADIFTRLSRPSAPVAVPASSPRSAVPRLPHVVLNFGGVTYVNSSHLAGMLRLRKRVVEAGASLVLCSMNDEVLSVLMLTGLDKIFRFAPDPLTALAGLQLDDEARGARG